MKRKGASTKETIGIVPRPVTGVDSHPRAGRITRENLDPIFAEIGQKLREGHSSEAEQLLNSAILDYDHLPDDLANLKRLLSFTLETLGRYKESLEALKPF